MATYCRGDDGFDAALAEIVEEDRGKAGGITDQDEVFRVSVIKGLKGQGEDLTIVRTVVDPKLEPSPQAKRVPAWNGNRALTILADHDENGAGERGGSRWLDVGRKPESPGVGGAVFGMTGSEGQ
jgi:hypothetical protein